MPRALRAALTLRHRCSPLLRRERRDARDGRCGPSNLWEVVFLCLSLLFCGTIWSQPRA